MSVVEASSHRFNGAICEEVSEARPPLYGRTSFLGKLLHMLVLVVLSCFAALAALMSFVSALSFFGCATTLCFAKAVALVMPTRIFCERVIWGLGDLAGPAS